MGHIKFFGIKIADFSMKARIMVMYIKIVKQASNTLRMIVTRNINENRT